MLWHVVETQLCQIIRSSIMLNVRAWIQWFMQTLVSAHFTFFHIDAVKYVDEAIDLCRSHEYFFCWPAKGWGRTKCYASMFDIINYYRPWMLSSVAFITAASTHPQHTHSTKTPVCIEKGRSPVASSIPSFGVFGKMSEASLPKLAKRSNGMHAANNEYYGYREIEPSVYTKIQHNIEIYIK